MLDIHIMEIKSRQFWTYAPEINSKKVYFTQRQQLSEGWNTNVNQKKE